MAATPIGPGVLAARVRDAAGKPVAGAEIVVAGPADRRVETTDGGLAIFQALPLGTYDVRVTSRGYRPAETSVAVRAAAGGVQLLELRVVANAGNAANVYAIARDEQPADDPYLSHALVSAPEVDVVADRELGGRAAVSSTRALDARIDLDGIPLPDVAAASSALRIRSALGTDAVDVVPALTGAAPDTPAGTVGGSVALRTADVAHAPSTGAVAGYDSTFGSFQRVRFAGGAGRFAVASDVVSGGAENRTQTFKARADLSPVTSLAVASYGAQAAQRFPRYAVDDVAPAHSYELRTSVAGVSLTARRYDSALLESPLERAPAGIDARIAGTQVRLDVPLGGQSLSFGVDRRREAAAAGSGSYGETRSTYDLRGSFAIARSARLELGDASSDGGFVHARHDPHAALDVRLARRASLRFFAGSAYVAFPVERLATLVPLRAATSNARAFAPETSFGYRVTADVQLRSDARAWASLFTLRRYGVLAQLSQGAARGIEVGYERRAARGGIGVSAYADLARTYEYGAPSVGTRAAIATHSLSGEQLPGDAYAKARTAVDYRGRDGVDVRFGATLLGNDNAFTRRPLVLGDLGIRVPLGDTLEARLGLSNLFRQRIGDPTLAREFVPREITLTFGRR